MNSPFVLRGLVFGLSFALACSVGSSGRSGGPSDGAVDSAAVDTGGWPDIPRPPRPDVGPVDAPLNPDAACASTSVAATVERLPVDIIWMVDNSVSMAPAVDEVTAGLNTFAGTIAASGLDYRVIMLSLRSPTNPVTVRGRNRYAVCIPEPLAGDPSCGDGPRFFQSSIDVLSTQPLEQFLGTLGQTAGYRAGDNRGGDPWHPFLRPEATKTIVIVTDDNARLNADRFERFAGGSNPWNSTTLPPGILDASWGGLFDGYVFDSIYGWGSATDPMVRCDYPGGGNPPSSGPTYTDLVARTSGVRAQICVGATGWSSFFNSVATAVVSTSRIACSLTIPPPPVGLVFDPTKVNVIVEGAMTSTALRKVTGPAACAAGGWHYDNEAMPTQVVLCPTSCTDAQARADAEGSVGVTVQLGCDTLLI